MKGKADTSKKGEGRLKAAGGASKRKKDAAAAGKPKRPPSAFFVFMSEFRQQYNAENPNNKSVANVSKAAGEKWRAMSDEDKAPYVEKAEQKKKDYEKTKATFDNKVTLGSWCMFVQL
uniref:HMG box domain-containing protein n=1 Tax=Triticum urartu TaxID=4572 RepID=A0A8R7QPT6_TRIUA